MMNRYLAKCSLTLIILLTAPGCGAPGSAPTAPAEGRVTYNGKPATEVRVIFTPESGRPALGHTDGDGHFHLTTFQKDDGAVPGKHKVTVSDRKRNWLPDPKTNKVAPGRFPERYQSAATTPWEVEVRPGGTNDFELKMVDDAGS